MKNTKIYFKLPHTHNIQIINNIHTCLPGQHCKRSYHNSIPTLQLKIIIIKRKSRNSNCICKYSKLQEYHKSFSQHLHKYKVTDHVGFAHYQHLLFLISLLGLQGLACDCGFQCAADSVCISLCLSFVGSHCIHRTLLLHLHKY